jgi:hypothetical protein
MAKIILKFAKGAKIVMQMHLVFVLYVTQNNIFLQNIKLQIYKNNRGNKKLFANNCAIF